MGKQKKYWKGIEEFEQDASFKEQSEKEFSNEVPVDEFLNDEKIKNSSTSRRDFLKYLGFSAAAASVAACETPIQKAIPYLNKPVEVTPGVANWYASAYYDGHDYCDVLVKTREGRPIKIEGNNLSPITKGGVNARVHASVLSLYDNTRLKQAYANGKAYSWEAVDKAIVDKLNSIAAAGGNIRILSSTIISPSTLKAIGDFKSTFEGTEHIMCDAISYSGMRKANEKTFGKSFIPSYHFDKAGLVLSFGADFLGNWLSPVEFSKQYSKVRKPSADMSRHIQVESNLSITGSNADKRLPVKPSEQGAYIVQLYNYLATRSGNPELPVVELEYDKEIMEIAAELWNNKGEALVVCGSNDPEIQLLVNSINKMLGAYKNCIDIEKPLMVKQGDDEKVMQLAEEMNAGDIDALLIYNCNPEYTLPQSARFKEGLSQVGLSISFSDKMDETSRLTDFVCPDHHALESWNDAQPKKGILTLTQPVIAPLFDTRQFQDSILKWAGKDVSFHDYMKENWESSFFNEQGEYDTFTSFWTHSLQDGVAKGVFTDTEDTGSEAVSFQNPTGLEKIASALNKKTENTGEFEIVFYEKAGLGDGRQSNNPWLQELPDPISKITWDNYITMSPKQMKEHGFNVKQGQRENADLVNLKVNGVSVKVPVIAQPGQKYGTLGIAFGYGRKGVGKAAEGVGVNIYPMLSFNNGVLSYESYDAGISGTLGDYPIAATQTHHTMMGRDLVKETNLEAYINDPSSGNPQKSISVKEGHGHKDKPVDEITLWEQYEESGQFWNLSIDLNACTGCGACVISCQAENNVSVVGKDEVRRAREMHWIRIDRYYSSDADDHDLSGMEVPSENPSVTFQPVMCQHCNHAPCETVCPVIATSHSIDGLNQMTYNRCVGTRYCANNCPYKVRRFNWFNYNNDVQFTDVNPAQDDLGRMVLNPDVVVRSRGVMEKCSMCVHRIQEGKLKAKSEGRELKDGEIQMACSQSCPTDAIVFGDKNQEGSKVAEMNEDERSYSLLEEVGVRPNVHYLTKVRNKNNIKA